MFLIVIAFALFFITKVYERRLISRNSIKIMNSYSPFKKTKGFKKENGERYVRYYEKNKHLSYQDVVIRVNIGLDYGFYGYIKNTDINKDYLVLVNKYLKLNKNYSPHDLKEISSKYFINGNNSVRFLRKDARDAFERLSYDSIKNGTPVYGQSAYRTYEKQVNLYRDAIKNNGQAIADSDTARPGHSEHQTGLSIDVSSNRYGNMLSFDKTPSFYWLQNNAYKYGFILRYPKGKENIHGFVYESWHYRYVGEKVAKDMHDNYSNLTFDEYYYRFIDK